MSKQKFVLRSADGKSYYIAAEGLTIGSLPVNQVVIEDPQVAGRHAQILLAGDRCWVRSERATTGTYINGQRIAGQQELGIGDVLQDWTDDEAVKPGDDWNILRAVASGTDLSFYVNDTLVWAGSDSSYGSGRVGLAMYRKADSSGDLLMVDWAVLTPLIFTAETSVLSKQTIDESPDDLNWVDDGFAP